MNRNVTQESLNLLKEALATDNPALLQKTGWSASGTATSGLTFYDLEGPSKKLFPVPTPLRNAIPRVSGGRGIQANWRAVTALNSANVPATVPEGKRGGVVTTTTADYLAIFRGFGLEDTVSFEAEYAAEGFEDLRALSQENLLKGVMIEEEALILGGQGTYVLPAIGKPVGAAVANATRAGTMTSRTVVCFVLALTLDGYRRAGVTATGVVTTVAQANGGPYAGTTTVNAGHNALSTGADGVTIDGSTNTGCNWSVAAVKGAFAYAWYTGTTNTAGSHLAAITTTNTFQQTADEAGTTQAANASGLSTDASQNTLAFDGLTAQIAKTSSGAYYKTYDGATFTFSGGKWVELETALADRWNNYKLSFTDIWLSGSDILSFSKGVMTGSNAVYRVNTENGDTEIVGGGMVATRYLNGITGQMINVHVHPNLGAGKVLATSSTLPYPLSGVPSVMRMLMRQEYRSWDWPVVQRQYEFGVYADGVLQNYFPASMGLIDNGVFA